MQPDGTHCAHPPPGRSILQSQPVRPQGRTQTQTTMRYAHLADAALREATTGAAERLEGIARGRPAAEVVRIERDTG